MDDHLAPIQLPPLREHGFHSSVPIFGPLIRLARRTLYALTARWGVRVVIDQQNRVNHAVARYLREFDERLIDQDRDLARLSRLLAELEIRQRHLAKQIEPAATPPESARDV